MRSFGSKAKSTQHDKMNACSCKWTSPQEKNEEKGRWSKIERYKRERGRGRESDFGGMQGPPMGVNSPRKEKGGGHWTREKGGRGG